MREYKINKNDSGQRLNKFLEKTVPLLPSSMMYKYLRLKRIKVNGKKTQFSYNLNQNDIVQLYINDEFFENKNEQKEDYTKIKAPNINIIYEDENIMIVDKPSGMVVHTDERGQKNTLIANIQSYLYQTKQWLPECENSFTPALCNRIDRNTGGIVIAAKNSQSLRILNEKIKNQELIKKYICIVHNTPKTKSGLIKSYLKKDEKQKLVKEFKNPVKDAKTAKTIFKTLDTKNNLSLVECTLLTGRTHQIRVHMSGIGCPLLGDGKYGKNEKNKQFKENSQLLYSYKLTFSFKSSANQLEYLNGKTFTVKNIPFTKKYFPNFKI